MTDLLWWCFVAFSMVISDAQQLDGPIIISPSEILLQNKQNYTIRCKGKRPINFTIQEAAEDEETDFKKILRKLAPSDNEYEYEVALDLVSVDRFAVGYYACHDDQVDPTQIFDNLLAEPTDNEHISYTYVYVNDTLNLIAPMREIVYVVKAGAKTVIQCRPTFPDVEVNLTMKNVTQQVKSNQSKKSEIVRVNKIGFVLVKERKANSYSCEGRRGSHTSQKTAHIYLRLPTNPSDAVKPQIITQDNRFLPGQTIFMNCTFNYTANSAVSLNWKTPRELSQDNVKSNENEITTANVLYKAIWVKNATEKDAGDYICEVKTASHDTTPSTQRMKYLASPYLKLSRPFPTYNLFTHNPQFNFVFELDGYPPPEYRFIKDTNSELFNGTKTRFGRLFRNTYQLTVSNVNIYDTGNYTMEATNAHGTKKETYHLNVYDIPRIRFDLSEGRKLKGQRIKLVCEVTGYELPNVEWSFIDAESNETLGTSLKGSIKEESEYKIVSTLDHWVQLPGTIICSASNPQGKANITRNLLVNEIEDGFGIENEGKKVKEVSEGQPITLRCLASRYDFTSVQWYGPNGEQIPDFESRNAMSLIATMQTDDATTDQTGNYTCVGYNNITDVRSETISVVVAGTREPTIIVPSQDIDKEVIPFTDVTLTCIAVAVPPPIITWYKDDIDIGSKVISRSLNYSTVNSTYTFKQNGTDESLYECVARSGTFEARRTYRVTVSLTLLRSRMKWEYICVIVAIMLVLVLLVLYLCWKIRKEKRFRKELAAAGLLYFKEGAPKSLNPELGIDEQAELLPYDDKFEFPSEKLILGPQLGAGAFGVVYKAEARGIIHAEESTTVAVKMVKKTADNIYIKALASELKIMVHLGKHINIVNLLGACTKNVGKRELIVIVEFCKFGNIHNYMQRHRDVFIDQLTDNKEKQGNVNRGFSCSGGDSGMTSDCLNTNQTQQTDHTFLNTAASNRSGRLASETGYVQPEWRTNYESDYVYEGRKPRPLTSRDLLAWAFQIARGMEYLASMKILHGDLAARNILLAEDNVVKICDFGLARSIYKNDEYQKKENSPLPVKWLAIECMTDRIFSTQSDVWSFGIVLWELFSLAKTPYPEISPQDLLQRLQEGHRLSKPLYADDRLYRVMRSCWEQRPTKRPTFTELQETIGSFLEDSVRNHYVELNQPCADTNADRVGENYLVQVCAPDYNNQVTPSPHHYANDAGFFFGVNPSPTPAQLQHDDEGYLAMTPASNQNVFSPRIGSAFDFDAQKLNGRASAASQGSELTPMLTLNHLRARSGTESDHEGGTSPYLNMIPRIEEESDEVFELETKKNNLKNSHNNAVTNPTYITFPTSEKSPIVSNNYVNVNGNGLVK